jgi:NAD(P)-dependent dehydrogenase (short-subunit alcohol dehydrogenase family)
VGVVVVTGGGAGIGAAVAEALGREDHHVVTLDPLVSLDGSERLPEPEETTAGRIVAAGGSAEASSASVTDRDAVEALFDRLVAEHGRLDAVVNVAGISRPTSFTGGTDADWRSVLTVHLDGYRTILGAALPRMAAAGCGRILGVTSGSGWRAADAGAYGCAKRAVAALTWQLGRATPEGITVNAMSPIAVTRMVTAALGRAPAGASARGSSATGGLSLGSMPMPEELGPTGAYLASEAFAWSRGTIVFVGGSEVAVVEEPQLLEVVRTAEVTSLARVLEAVVPGALAPAEAAQAAGGGSNPRFPGLFSEPGGELAAGAARTCAVVSDRPAVAAAVTAALEARAIEITVLDASTVPAGFESAAGALAAAEERSGAIDAVVVALAGPAPSSAATEWERILDEHEGAVDGIHADAGWARAVADRSAGTDRPIRLVTLTDAVTAGGASRAQAAAQHARSARRATKDRVAAFAVSAEASAAGTPSLGELAAHLVGSPEAVALSGAELVAGTGWVGLRSHPRPTGSITFGGPEVPSWLDATLRAVVGAGTEEA